MRYMGACCFGLFFAHVFAFFGFSVVFGSWAVINLAVDPYIICFGSFC